MQGRFQITGDKIRQTNPIALPNDNDQTQNEIKVGLPSYKRNPAAPGPGLVAKTIGSDTPRSL
jgi:hypothetical protein